MTTERRKMVNLLVALSKAHEVIDYLTRVASGEDEPFSDTYLLEWLKPRRKMIENAIRNMPAFREKTAFERILADECAGDETPPSESDAEGFSLEEVEDLELGRRVRAKLDLSKTCQTMIDVDEHCGDPVVHIRVKVNGVYAHCSCAKHRPKGKSDVKPRF